MSSTQRYTPKKIDTRMTTTVVAYTSLLFGQVTRFSSLRTSLRNRRVRSNQLPADSLTLPKVPVVSSAILRIPQSAIRNPQSEGWQARRESNPQPPVLETGALPIEL